MKAFTDEELTTIRRRALLLGHGEHCAADVILLLAEVDRLRALLEARMKDEG